MNARPSNDPTAENTVAAAPTARHPHPHRMLSIALLIGAAALILVAAWCALNLSAIQSYNQATQALTGNIKAFQTSGTDLSTLRTRQQQTDEQFAGAGTFQQVLLPEVSRSVRANTVVSRTLTELINQALKQKNGTDSKHSGPSSSSSSSSSSSPTSASDGSLTDEQRKKVEELLKSNDRSASSSSTSQPQQSGGNASVKPW